MTLYKDLAERALSTFIQAFLGVLATSQLVQIDASLVEGALLAGISAALSVIKGSLASKAPLGSDSASLVD
tara:strand:- start:682 stop:894 length:213 start_codon:yes stop_codon:yes gene_type:complete